LRKWPTGIFVAWYPVTDGEVGRRLADAARSAPFPKALRAEFLPYRPDGVRMAGGGLLICNTPWQTRERLEALCGGLATILGDGHATWRVEPLTPA
jgi:23S rRNA (adenine2030-N6)-methyltransferase